MDKKRITIVKNGPYIVSGNIPISKKIIIPQGKGYILKEEKVYKTEESYCLCRCGNSKSSPFCDGSHEGFDGEETASREKFVDRMKMFEGPDMDMMDDQRCALARFCHREDGSAWELVKKTDDPKMKEEAIKAAVECPAGRLVALEKSGKEIEPEYEPEIEVLEDPEKEVSGPLAVKGNIELVSSDGYVYEQRNRITLCRCGASKNKPFCDARHIKIEFRDRECYGEKYKYTTEKKKV